MDLECANDLYIDQAVTLTFNSLSLELDFDFIEIFDGPDDVTAPSLGEFTGGLNPGSFTSTHVSGCLSVIFISDGSVTQDGWDATVTSGPVDFDTCPSETCEIVCPAGPLTYSMGQGCNTFTIPSNLVNVQGYGCASYETVPGYFSESNADVVQNPDCISGTSTSFSLNANTPACSDAGGFAYTGMVWTVQNDGILNFDWTTENADPGNNEFFYVLNGDWHYLTSVSTSGHELIVLEAGDVFELYSQAGAFIGDTGIRAEITNWNFEQLNNCPTVTQLAGPAEGSEVGL